MYRQSLSRRSGARLFLLLVVALVVAAAVAAAPAAAAPTPTVLTVNAQSSSVTWGSTAAINGILQTAVQPPQALDGQQVLVEYSTSSIGPWQSAGTVTNTAAPYTSGEYTYSWTAIQSLYWRMSFAGTAEWAAYPGNVVLVKVTPAIGKPGCPSSIQAGKKFTVSGSLKPKYKSGAKTVTVKAQRYSHGKWKSYSSYAAKNADSGSYTKYSVKISISKKGKYRFYATTQATSTLAAGRSANSRTLQVK